MNLTSTEVRQISERVAPLFDKVLERYDFEKYPADQYERFKREFSDPCRLPPIEDALRWKWGHWGKANFPQAHKRLIAEISDSWPDFIAGERLRDSRSTFDWWSRRLGRSTTYITVAFVTHLTHHSESLPIIDQHNFRAMNDLAAKVRGEHKGKKKPSTWADIQSLRSFLLALSSHLEGRTLGELDRFLMMYGRYFAAR